MLYSQPGLSRYSHLCCGRLFTGRPTCAIPVNIFRQTNKHRPPARAIHRQLTHGPPHRPPSSRRPRTLFTRRYSHAAFPPTPTAYLFLQVVRLGEMLCLNAERFSPDPAEAEAERAEGYALYEEKPTLRKGNIKRVAADGETHTVFPHVPIRVSISGRVGCTWGSPRVDFRFGFGRPCLFRVWISCQSDGSGLFRSRSVFRWARRELGSDLFLIPCLLPGAPGRGQLPAWVFFSSPLSISGCAGGHVVRRGVWNGRVSMDVPALQVLPALHRNVRRRPF